MRTLLELNNKYREGDWPDRDTVHSYISVYEKILAPYRHTALNVLEIGLFSGASLKVWEEYFTMADVYGIDCDEQPHGGMADLRPLIASGQHRIVIGNATSEADIEKHFGNIKWDVVIDDGSHWIVNQLETFDLFKDRMNKGAIFIIEDIQEIDKHRWVFESLKGDFTVEIMDRRQIKGRYDDVLCIVKF